MNRTILLGPAISCTILAAVCIIWLVVSASRQRETLREHTERLLELERRVRTLEAVDYGTFTVTAYSPDAQQCDNTPFTNAMNCRVRAGQVAVSRDLFRNGWTFGKRVYIEGHGMYVIADLMNKRHKGAIDIFMYEKDRALRFGKRKVFACLVQ